MSDTHSYPRIPVAADDKLWVVVSRLAEGHPARDEYADLLCRADWGKANRRRLAFTLVILNTFGLALALAVCARLASY